MLLTVEVVCCILGFSLALPKNDDLLSSLDQNIIIFLDKERDHISNHDSI